MPLWRIFSHPDTFTPAQRDALALAVTDLYDSRGLPRFYVNVLFIDLDENHTYVGGEKTKSFVRIVIEQIARTMPDPSDAAAVAYRKSWMDKLHATLKPHILDREGLNLELHLYNTPRDLWRIQGLDPPPVESEAGDLWKRENRPIAWEV